MNAASDSLVGQVLADTYVVERLLGRGSMGAVYVAKHQRLPSRVAVKVLLAEAASNPEIFARFRREAEITSGLRHPNLMQALDFNHLADGTPYIIMEYLEGEDLGAHLRGRGRIGYAEAAHLAHAVGAGLTAAHGREVVHRDLNPPNIFLARHEQGAQILVVPKIVNFSIAKIRHAHTDTQRTQDQQLLGTPHYMSPEQARGENAQVDHRTDQWALAAILYECLSGQRAFNGSGIAAVIYQVVMVESAPLSELVADVPAHAVAAIQRALSKHREQRFPSVAEFVDAFCAGAPVTPLALTTGLVRPDQRPRWPRSWPLVPAAGLLLTGLLWAVGHRGATQRSEPSRLVQPALPVTAPVRESPPRAPLSGPDAGVPQPEASIPAMAKDSAS